MGSCQSSNSLQKDYYELQRFVTDCHRHKWEDVRRHLTFINVNHKLKYEGPADAGVCLLAQFLRSSDGKQAEILEDLLFPQPFNEKPRRPCDIFDQEFIPAKSKETCRYPSPFIFLFEVRTSKNGRIPRDRSLAPYVKLLLEAADILPSPQNRNDPSLWTKYGDRWNHDKEAFVWNEVVLTFLKYHAQDVETFKLILDTEGLMSDDHVIEFICLIAAMPEPTTPILQHLLSSGKFDAKLKNENISSSFPYTFWAGNYNMKSLCPPLLAAACSGNVEFVKELIANNVGGDINVAQLTKPTGHLPFNLGKHDLSKISKIARGNYDGKNSELYFNDINILHLVAAVETNSHATDKNFDDILTVLLAMPGSTELKNAIAPFHVGNVTDDKLRREVTPTMLAAITGHESRMKILLANGGDKLPESLQSKFSSFDKWLEDYNNSDYPEDYNSGKPRGDKALMAM